MDFSPSETQVILAKSITDLLGRTYDAKTRRAYIADDPKAPDFWGQLAELGLPGIEIEERFGGSGAGFEELAAVLQPFGQALVVQPFVPAVVMANFLVNVSGTEAQKSAYLPGLAAGEVKLILAHGERQARQDLHSVLTTAAATIDGFRLNGTKTIVLGGDAADSFIVSARGPDGVSLFLVPGDAAGLIRRHHKLYDGTGAADVTLHDVIVPAAAVLGAPGDALPLIETAYDRGAAAICVEAVGVMERLCDMTVDYLNTREQFGQKIGKFQVLQHRAVDMRIALELARSMALVAIDAITRLQGAERSRLVSAAKVVIGNSARTVGQSAVQLHGGIALTDEYDAGHYFKRLTAIERLFGDARYHTERFALKAG